MNVGARYLEGAFNFDGRAAGDLVYAGARGAHRLARRLHDEPRSHAAQPQPARLAAAPLAHRSRRRALRASRLGVGRRRAHRHELPAHPVARPARARRRSRRRGRGVRRADSTRGRDRRDRSTPVPDELLPRQRRRAPRVRVRRRRARALPPLPHAPAAGAARLRRRGDRRAGSGPARAAAPPVGAPMSAPAGGLRLRRPARRAERAPRRVRQRRRRRPRAHGRVPRAARRHRRAACSPRTCPASTPTCSPGTCAPVRRSAPATPPRGPMALAPPSERFHWLTAPRSDVLQSSPVHEGICDDPRRALDRAVRGVRHPRPSLTGPTTRF